MMHGAILSGGQARRMGGRDKSRLLIDGRTLLAHQLDVLGPCVRRTWLVGRQAPSPDPRAESLPDRTPGMGPLGGLDAALTAAGGDAVLLLACDLPNVTTPLLVHLVGLSAGVDAVVPRTERGYHPLCAVYGPSCGAAVRRRLELGALRMRDLLGDLRVRTVDADDLTRFGSPDHLMFNINTVADLDALNSLSH